MRIEHCPHLCRYAYATTPDSKHVSYRKVIDKAAGYSALEPTLFSQFERRTVPFPAPFRACAPVKLCHSPLERLCARRRGVVKNVADRLASVHRRRFERRERGQLPQTMLELIVQRARAVIHAPRGTSGRRSSGSSRCSRFVGAQRGRANQRTGHSPLRSWGRCPKERPPKGPDEGRHHGTREEGGLRATSEWK